MKRFYHTLILLSLLYAQTEAQSDNSTSVTGKVLDRITQKPMDYATISIKEKGTGRIVTGTVTNTGGEFTINNIPYGSYDVDISFLSYKTSSVEDLNINNGNTSVSLGTILLSPSDVSLGEVAVVSDRPVIENKIGKVVYNVTSDVSSQGGLAIDVLKKVPQVTVDADGNVELQGNANIRFLINGKTSSVFGTNIADALASIPASQIKSIEAITNPGAKYDSEGTGGIINIILLDNKLQGMNGNANLSGGTRLYNSSLNIGAKRNSFGVNAFLSANGRLREDAVFTANREATDTASGIKSILDQRGFNYIVRSGFRSGAGFEWDISEKDNLTGSVGYNYFIFGFSGLTNISQTMQDLGGNDLSVLNTVRNAENTREISSIDWNLNYIKKFNKEGHELGIIFNSSFGRPRSGYTQEQSYTGEFIPFSGSASKNPGRDNQAEASIDYKYPLNDKLEFETGVKAIYQDLSSVANVTVLSPSVGEYLPDPLQSYNLNYKMNIYAGYIQSTFRLFNFLDLKPGVRYEYTDVSIDYPNTSVPSYGTIVPSMVLSHSFNERKSLELAYSKRIERPDYDELNPFINRSDPFNISTGNIFLKPEIGNNIELSLNTGFKKGGNLRISLIERINSQEIQNLTVFYPEYVIGDSTFSNVSVSTRENIGEEYNTGLSMSGSVPVTRKLTLRGNFMLFHNYLVSNTSVGSLSTGLRFRGNMNATYELPKDLVLEFFGFWRSSAREIQGKTPQFFIYNFALRKRFWHQNGSLGFTATNFLNRNLRFVSTITTENSISTSVREVPFRSFGLSFTYKFGKMEPSRRNQSNENDQLNGPGF